MSARGPKDEDEHFKALLAILNGRGRSIAEVIEELTGETPSEETVEAVKNRLQMAQESGEDVDIVAVVRSLNDLAEQWA
ncbi:MAG: hypothetical protein CMB00_02260 [Euryarchaeota archaeon]|jgi:hypothetical protein|nr:hypothetical protein [Euryarchaeota archaeon]DAC22432.1 MAG TPA: hypothetical protein D7H91_02520 [Candidatus Poseidoniales archaeon]HII77885.1 hypothetical protein [Poseidonia sp.]|tara:strand:+ start:286 stop:522 length:237 start_codon:yes stop_codon:yes gene_type:complete